ncbi:hypothetical protein N836_06545 [Leptolyngbya sp. Heron Island J]|nr:hypothetical protein N836_06545 [Leptolyngbya sp. Heron Island J]
MASTITNRMAAIKISISAVCPAVAEMAVAKKLPNNKLITAKEIRRQGLNTH